MTQNPQNREDIKRTLNLSAEAQTVQSRGKLTTLCGVKNLICRICEHNKIFFSPLNFEVICYVVIVNGTGP